MDTQSISTITSAFCAGKRRRQRKRNPPLSSLVNKKKLLEWVRKPDVNPLTQRKLKPNSAMYHRFWYMAKEMLTQVTLPSLSCGSLLWVIVNDTELNEHYGEKKHIIKCKNCNCFTKRLSIKHCSDDECGDYKCFRCEKDVNLFYKCYNSKCTNVTNIDDSDDDT